MSCFIIKILRTPVFDLKYPDRGKPSLTAAMNVAKRSRIVWLQTKILTFFLAVCLYARRQISIVRLATKAKKHMKSSEPSKIFWPADGVGEVVASSEVVAWDRSYVYVVCSREVTAMSVVMVEKKQEVLTSQHRHCSTIRSSWRNRAFYTVLAYNTVHLSSMSCHTH